MSDSVRVISYVKREEYDELAELLARERERTTALREAIERDAAEQALAADLGASEWEEFVGKHTWAALAASSSADPTQEPT